MAKKKSLKFALFTAILSLIVCLSMFAGTTFAWFTDSVTSANNVIRSGNLDISLEYWDGDSWEDVNGASNIISGSNWEPGYTQVAYFKIENEGSLALKYQFGVNVIAETIGKNVKGGDIKLSDIIEFGVIEGVNGETNAYANRAAALDAVVNAKVISEGYYNANNLTNKGDVNYLAMVVYMPTTVGNEANHNGVNVPQIDLGIKVDATQLMSEQDAFGSDYDGGAHTELPANAVGSNTVANAMNGNVEVIVRQVSEDPNVENNPKKAHVTIPVDAIASEASEVTVTVEEVEANTNFRIEETDNVRTFDVTVDGIKENNTEEITLQIQVGAGKDVKAVYHYADSIDFNWNPTTGYVTIQTTSFSPFTVVIDEEPYVFPEVDEESLPKATVSEYTDIQNIEWGNYGQWSPTEGLEANLDIAYKFVAPHDSETVKGNPYEFWYCDFYVMLDTDLGEDEIFLGGNYGSFGWVGFHNGDVTLGAKEEIGLLESVTTNPWTYSDVVNNVGEFICGVGNVGNSLSGATFTVMLRLTNPENEKEFYNVATITYKFGA